MPDYNDPYAGFMGVPSLGNPMSMGSTMPSIKDAAGMSQKELLKNFLLEAITKGPMALGPGRGAMAGVRARIGSPDPGITGGTTGGIPQSNSAVSLWARGPSDVKNSIDLRLPRIKNPGLEAPANQNMPPEPEYVVNPPEMWKTPPKTLEQMNQEAQARHQQDLYRHALIRQQLKALVKPPEDK